VLLIAVLAVAFVSLIASRLTGGSSESPSGNTADAGSLVQKAFSSSSVESGRFDGSMSATVQAANGGAARELAVTVKGAFDATDASAPKVDVEFSARGGGQSFSTGFVSTGKEAFVEVNGRAYQFPQSEFDRAFRSAGSQSKDTAALFRSLGVDPTRWLVQPTKQGTVNVDGVPTTHVTAGVAVNRMLDDFYALAQRSGANGVSRKELDQAKSAFTGTTVDLFIANSDGTLRKLSGATTAQAPQGSAAIKFDAALSDVNEPQKISAPSDARPIAGFEQALTRAVLGQLGSTRNGSGGRSAAGGSAGSGSAGGAASGTSGQAGSGITGLPPAAQDYLRCVQHAGSSSALQRCAPLLD
jgi:hypothetical protein